MPHHWPSAGWKDSPPSIAQSLQRDSSRKASRYSSLLHYSRMSLPCFTGALPLSKPGASSFSVHRHHRQCSRSSTRRPRTAPGQTHICTRVHARRELRMGAASAERAIWAEQMSNSYDGEKYQFRDVSLIVPLGAKIALLGGNGGALKSEFPCLPYRPN